MITLRCLSYSDGSTIPARFAHRSINGGKNISPGFEWIVSQSGAKSYALSIIDPHPVARNWVHWFVINIPPGVSKLQEGASLTKNMPAGSRELSNTYNETGYGGPAPPEGSGAHPYIATLYALDVPSLELPVKTSREQFQSAVERHVIEKGEMKGFFECV